MAMHLTAKTASNPQLKNWHRADIIAAVKKKGASMQSLAVRHGKRKRTVCAALTVPARPSNKIIADFIGIPVYEIWPEWFDREGRYLDAARALLNADRQRRNRFSTTHRIAPRPGLFAIAGARVRRALRDATEWMSTRKAELSSNAASDDRADLNQFLLIRRNVFAENQATMAAIAGVTQGTWSQWENGTRRASTKHIARIIVEAKRRRLPWDDRWFSLKINDGTHHHSRRTR